MATNGEALVLTSGPSAITPMQLLEMAMSQNADLEKLKQLMDLQERWEKNEARKAFVEAINTFKLRPPEIVKNRVVRFGNTQYSHATLDNVVDAVTEALSAVGISHRWTVKQDDKLITVICCLTHKMGHSEETAISGPPDTSGSKNPITAIGSTVTYLQRYTLMAACGLAAAEDDDGQTSSGESIGLTDERYVELLDSVKESNTVDELKKLYFIANKEAAAAKDTKAQTEFAKAKNARYREIANASR